MRSQPDHSIPDPDMGLDVFGMGGVDLDLLSKGCHEYTMTRHIGFQGVPPDLVRDKGVGQDLPDVL